MQDSGSFFHIYKEYFANTVLLPLFVVAVVLLLKKWGKEKRDFFIITVIASVLLVYNGVTYYVTTILGEGDTYYRFFWMCPMVLLVAVVMTEILSTIKKGSRYLFILLVVVMCLAFSSKPLSNWSNIPENVYQVDDEVIEVSDAIMKLKEGEYTTIIDNNNLRNELRQYNAKIGFTETDALELSNILHLLDTNYPGRSLMSYLQANNSEYVVLEKQKLVVCRLLETTGLECVAETDNYYIYEMNYAQMVDDENDMIAIQERTGVVTNMEYIQTMEVEGVNEFIYLSDFGGEESNEFYRRIVDEVNAGESQYVIINSQLADDENWYEEKQTILDALEVPYYCNDQDFQVIEKEEYVICLIDNLTGISDETMQKFRNLKNRQVPFLLVLSKEMSEEDEIYTEVMEEDSKVIAILTAKKESYMKDMIEDRVLCYATPTDVNTFFTIMRLKGLETE